MIRPAAGLSPSAAEPFRSRALEGRRPAEPPAELDADDEPRLAQEPLATLNRLLFPARTREFQVHLEQYGDVSVLLTQQFLYCLRSDTEHAVDLDPGVTLLMGIGGIEAIGDPDERGKRTGMCTLNGQLRPGSVRDGSVDAQVKAAEKADRSQPGQVGPVRRRRHRRGLRGRGGGGRSTHRHHPGDEEVSN